MTDLHREVGTLFGLEEAAIWRELGGSQTTNLLVDDRQRGPVVLRVHPAWTSAERVVALQQIRWIAAEAGVPVAVPLPDPDGRTWWALRDGRVVERESFLSAPDRMRTVDQLLVGCRMLARLHAALARTDLPAADRAPWTNHLDREAAPAALQSGLERVSGWGVAELTRWAEDVVGLADRIAEREPAGVPGQLTHGDFWDDNVLFADDRLVGVLDFGFVVRRPRIDDLALAGWFHLLDGRAAGGEPDLSAVEVMADAYDEAADQPLSGAERTALPWAVARQCTWALGVWVRGLPEAGARAHAREAVAELPVARALEAALT